MKFQTSEAAVILFIAIVSFFKLKCLNKSLKKTIFSWHSVLCQLQLRKCLPMKALFQKQIRLLSRMIESQMQVPPRMVSAFLMSQDDKSLCHQNKTKIVKICIYIKKLQFKNFGGNPKNCP